MDFKNLPEEIVWSGSVVASIIGLAIITKIINECFKIIQQ